MASCPQVSCLSFLSVNDKDGYEMSPEAVHTSRGIYLTSEENTGKPQLEKYSGSHRLKWGPLPINDVGMKA